MKRNLWLTLGAACLLTAALSISAAARKADEQLAARISPGILRFHILADSNRREDQELKLEVRSLLLDAIGELLSGEEGQGGGEPDKQDTVRCVQENAGALERLAEGFLAAKGRPEKVSVEVAEDYFPTKYYGDIRLPCGVYEAARVTIGRGDGHNWWCVLYPRLCFVEESWAEMPPESKEKLRGSLPERDYLAVLRPQPEIQIGWKFF